MNVKKNELRMQTLEKLIHEKGFMRICELAEMFDVSEMTIRRDIYTLEKQGIAKNLKGIVFASENTSLQLFTKQYDIREESNMQPEEKSALGAFAASQICEGDSILFDVGSTVGQIARFAPRDRNFNAFCVSLNSFLNLLDHPNAEIALAGGYFHPGTQMLLSEESLNFIYHIRATKLFLSAAGIHETMGISCANRFEVPVKNAMLKSSDKCILVADSSKFGVVRASHVCDLEQVDAIITDDELPDHWARFIEDRGITLHRVHLERGKNCVSLWRHRREAMSGCM